MIDRRSRMDEAIDRSVRDMVQRDPRPGFGRRVRARLTRPSRRAGWVPRLALATAAVATIVIAVTMVVRREPLDAPQPSRTVVATDRANPVPTRRAETPPAAPAAPQRAAAPAAGLERGSVPGVGSLTVPRAERQVTAFGPPRDRVAAASVVEEPGELTTPVLTTEGAGEVIEEIPPLSGPPPLVVPPLLTPPLQLDSVTVPPVQIAPVAPRREPR